MYSMPKFWLGSQESLDVVFEADRRVAELQAKGGMDGMQMPSLLAVQDGVGVISVSGSLIAGSAGWMSLFGVTGYDDIRAALAQAVSEPKVKSIMLHVSSGGGQVNGVEDLGQFLGMVKSFKPVTTFADGIMASAAYWIGSYGSNISTNKTSILGSIGVIVVHADRSKMYKDAGINVTVMRAGDYKALVNSMEPLSDSAKKELQTQLDTLYGIFTDNALVANRGMDAKQVDKAAQGREFLGEAAVSVGLADNLATYEQAIAYAKSLDKSKSSGNNPRNSKGATAMKVTLKPEQLAAYQAGATLQSLGFPADAEVEGNAADDGAAGGTDAAAAAAAAETKRLADEAAAETARLAAEAAAKTPPAGDVAALTASLSTATAENATLTAKMALLTEQLATAQTALTAAAAENLTIKAQHSALAAANADLVAIARSSAGKMLIALGGKAEAVEGMDGAAIVVEHKRLAETFNKKFHVGGVGASGNAQPQPAAASASPMHTAVIASGPQARQAQAAVR